MDAPDHITGLGGQIPIQTTPSSTSDAISETGGSYNDDTLLNELTTHAHHHRHPLGRLNEYCAGCGRSIMDQEYLGIQKTDKKWHIQCLRCYDCNEPLDKDQSCYVKQGNIFCRTDYFK